MKCSFCKKYLSGPETQPSLKRLMAGKDRIIFEDVHGRKHNAHSECFIKPYILKDWYAPAGKRNEKDK